MVNLCCGFEWVVPILPKDCADQLARISWENGDPKKSVFYQYIIRRVAYKDLGVSEQDQT